MSATRKYVTDAALNSNPSIDPVLLDTVILVVATVGTMSMCLFGVFANIVNIVLFRRLGYQDGVNITLTALAISDLGASMSEIAFIIIFNPYINELDLVVSKVVTRFVCSFVHEYFTRIGSAITAFAAFERCLCVTRPLKVKSLMTTKVSLMVNACIFLIYIVYPLPQFYSFDFDWTFIPERNRTVYVMYRNTRMAMFFPITYYFTDILFPYCIFLLLISCSAVLFTKLKSKAEWRQQISTSGDRLLYLNTKERKSGDRLLYLNTKERKSGLLFLSVSVMCVALVLPNHFLFTAVIFVKSLALDGALCDVRVLLGIFTTFLKIINSSCTIFIYYTMSTKYRLEFQKLFKKCDNVFCHKHEK